MALSKVSDVLAPDGSQTSEKFKFLQFFSVAKIPEMHTSLDNIIHYMLKD